MATSTSPRKKIILLGDSITQLAFDPRLNGFGNYLCNYYQRRADILNRGFAGYNTKWVLEYLSTEQGFSDIFDIPFVSSSTTATQEEEKLGNPNVCLVTIFFGANDASDPILNPRHHVSLQEYNSNLKKLIQIVRKTCPESKILLITPPPVHHESRLRYQIERYGDKATGKLERNIELSGSYARECEKVVQELVSGAYCEDDLACINLWKEFQSMPSNNGDENTSWGSMLSDGLHLSKEGNEFVGKLLISTIETRFPSLSVKACPFTKNLGNSGTICDIPKMAPWHDEIDHIKPKTAFSYLSENKK